MRDEKSYKEILEEMYDKFGIFDDESYLKNREERRMMMRRNPNMFLGHDHSNPTYAVRRGNGTFSLGLLKRSLRAAKASYTRCRKRRYKNLVMKITADINIHLKKMNKEPTYHKISDDVFNKLNNFKSLDGEDRY